MKQAVAALLLALLAGCTSTPGVPSPSSTISAAPPVVYPKDAQGITPCALLTAAQATALGVDPTQAKAGATADLVDCAWPGTMPPISEVAVTVDTNPIRRGLTDNYLKRDEFVVFEPLAVDGYPAVRAERIVTDDCALYVGLSDTQRMRVDVFTRTPMDTCPLARRAASAMLTNIPAQR